jgi:uncharacterized protein (TIGR03905 family)
LGIFRNLEDILNMDYIYQTKGVCARSIKLHIEDGIVTEVAFEGGCNGNTKGVSQLAVGMHAQDLIGKLKGIRCGQKETSCPDQLAIALEEALDQAEQAIKPQQDVKAEQPSQVAAQQKTSQAKKAGSTTKA